MRTFKKTDTSAPTQFPGAPQPPAEVDNVVGRPPALKGPPAEPAQIVSEAERYRPRQRPAFPILLILDDSQTSGESLRIRKSPFRIGRVEGDLTIPLDNQMSGSHAEIDLEQNQGQWCWRLKDLGSRNGTFVRVSQVSLKAGQVILLGMHRFRLDGGGGESRPRVSTPDRTEAWLPAKAAAVTTCVALVDLDSGEGETRYALTEREHWIGRDARQCSIVLDDPLVAPRHARIYRDDRGSWQLENEQSINGVWTRVEHIWLDHTMLFQCGEQRFQFKLV